MIRVKQTGFEDSEVAEVQIDEMDFHKRKWLDCYNLSKEEIEVIKNTLKIPKEEIERCIDEDERPNATELEHFSMLIFKCPFKKGKQNVSTSIALLISENLFVTFRQREIEGLERLWNLESTSLKKTFNKGTSRLACQLLERVMDDYFEATDDIDKEINKIENIVIKSPENEILMNISEIKKTLIYFHKALAANREVLSNIDEDYSERIDSSEIKNFRYVYDDTLQLLDMVGTYRDILSETLDIHMSAVSKNMNIIMKRITALGSLVLVPTFITGLYGMNFRYMPEIPWKYGYLLAWGLIIGSVMALYIYFKRKNWF
ncbi:MAG: magnesium/cobalt transporter CorA [Nanoarchaeota archaeon]|nr:magnesium/cobalt transporter CorA [Nanoarchaeota archaeon]MBU1854676.1 magnesium/cobalt transporter CorA [Nanoarchaeota archaeon]